MDDSRDTDYFVGTGTGEQLHDGRFSSYPAGNRYYCNSAASHSGTEVSKEINNNVKKDVFCSINYLMIL